MILSLHLPFPVTCVVRSLRGHFYNSPALISLQDVNAIVSAVLCHFPEKTTALYTHQESIMSLVKLPDEILDMVCIEILGAQTLYLDIQCTWEATSDTDDVHSEGACSQDIVQDSTAQDDGQNTLEADKDEDCLTIGEGFSSTTGSARKPAAKLHARRYLLDMMCVSRRMQRIVEPHLYAVFDQDKDDSILFLHQLVNKPYLRTYVRGLRIESRGSDFDWHPLSSNEFQLVSRLFSDMVHLATVASGNFSWTGPWPHSLQSADIQQEIIAQWLILHLPNCQDIRVSLPREWKFDIMRYIAKYDNRLCESLCALHVLAPPVWQSLYVLPSTVDLDPIWPLLDRPHLQTIVLHHCVSVTPREKPLICAREIWHQSCGSKACQIGLLTSSCKNLRKYYLEYECGIALDLSYLLNSRESLEWLELDTDCLSPNLLRDYPRLKHVGISAREFDSRRPGSLPLRGRQKSETSLPPLFALTYILPTGLESLVLDGQDVWEERLQSTVDTKTQRLHNLKSIEISWPPSDRLRKSCFNAGIQLLVDTEQNCTEQ